jgi:KipI family sensor histidine kinase inhibitor
MGQLPAELARPRRREPRTRVSAGSVAIANRMCVIYPWESPGGWHIVGACPVPLFDVARADPVLLSVGDRVRFIPISRSRYDELRNLALAGSLDLSALEAEA